jgi:hypothetical protein
VLGAAESSGTSQNNNPPRRATENTEIAEVNSKDKGKEKEPAWLGNLIVSSSFLCEAL